MKDLREEWYDAAEKVAVTVADVTGAAQALARGHLCGPTSAHFLAEALAAAALLAERVEDRGQRVEDRGQRVEDSGQRVEDRGQRVEDSGQRVEDRGQRVEDRGQRVEGAEDEEVLSIQMKCKGPLGGFNVECTSAGTLRGYTEKKVLDDFDGMGRPDARKIIGARQLQVTRSVPGKILSQGISNSLDGYLAGSLQRKAVVHLEASVTDDVEIVEARGIMVEALPDATAAAFSRISAWKPKSLAVASRNLLDQLGLNGAELKKSAPLRFACHCSPDRAAALLAALPEEERAALPPTIDVTCHMCGRTWTVKTNH